MEDGGVGVLDRSVDDKTFTDFYTAHHPTLLRFVRRQCDLRRLPVSRVDPQDIVQEVFTEALARWSTLRHPVRWTYTVARRRLGAHVRVTAPTVDVDVTDLVVPQDLTLDEDGRARDEPFQAALRGEVYGALLELPDRQRAATILRHVGGYSSAEIGGVLGCQPATADVHVFRGVQALRRRLAVAVAAIVALWVAVGRFLTGLNRTRPAAQATPLTPTPAPSRSWVDVGIDNGGGGGGLIIGHTASSLLIGLGVTLALAGCAAIVLLLRRSRHQRR